MLASLGRGRLLEAYSTEELESTLRHFDAGEWEESDAYERYEERAQRVNIAVYNAGQQYLEDTSVWLTIPKAPGLSLAKQVATKPYSSSALLSGDYSRSSIVAMGASQRYPEVKEEADHWVVSSRVGDLRHKLTTLAFAEPLRVSVTEEAAGKSFSLSFAVHGRQLPDTLRFDLTLVVDH
jgi:hypothetical protein